LRQAGAQIVSYVPNNAYLVQAGPGRPTTEGVGANAGGPALGTPFYKLDAELLPLAVEQKPLPPTRRSTLLLLPANGRPVAAGVGPGLERGDCRGSVAVWTAVRVRPASGALVALAQMGGARAELYHRRVLMNDRTREQLRVTTNTVDGVFSYGNLMEAGYW